MAVAERRNPQFQCVGKIRYSSKSDAKRILKRMQTTSYQDPKGLQVYRCGWCSTFHIGHTPKWRVDGSPAVSEAREGDERSA